MENPHRDDWSPFNPARWRELPVVASDGRRYRLVVAQPDAPAPVDGYPSLFVLDGVQHFAALASAASALSRRPEKTGVQPVAVFGVFHDTADGRLDADTRFRDFTSTAPADATYIDRPWGGGDAFRALLADRILPAAAAHLPLNPDRRGLFGHSLGGLFVLETLEKRPDLFDRWIAVSPSLWWRPDLAIDAPGSGLMVGCGERETGRDMLARITAWVEAAGARGDVRLSIAPDGDHGSTPFALIPEALRHAAGPRA